MAEDLLSHSDEEIGRLIREALPRLRSDKAMPALAVAVLVDTALASNSSTLTCAVFGLSRGSEQRGDWEVTLRRLPRWKQVLRRSVSAIDHAYQRLSGRRLDVPAHTIGGQPQGITQETKTTTKYN